jgi:hypothetical protein
MNVTASTTIELTWAKVKAAGAKAYQERRLSAQGPTPTCNYRDISGRPCVIGAALTDDQVKPWLAEGNLGENKYYIKTLRCRGVVSYSDRDSKKFSRLQGIHDEWCSSNVDGSEIALAKMLGVPVNGPETPQVSA